MDIYKAIRALQEERQRLDELIASLENLQAWGAHEQIRPPAGRRGRRNMSRQERLRISERMRNYWAERKKKAEEEATSLEPRGRQLTGD